MSRAQRILQCVAARPFPSLFDHIFAAVQAGEPPGKRKAGSLRAAVSAQLKQLVDAKKLRRTGTPGAYLYHATRLTHLDLRKVTEEGLPRNRKAISRQRRKVPTKAKAKAPKCPPVARLVASPATPAVRKPRPHQHMTIAPAPLPPTKPTPRTVRAETVDEFLARGGRIQHLANGEVSRPLKLNSLNAQQKRRRKAPATTTD